MSSENGTTMYLRLSILVLFVGSVLCGSTQTAESKVAHARALIVAPQESPTARLIQSILLLGDGPLGTISELREHLDVPESVRWPVSHAWKKQTVIEVPTKLTSMTLKITYKDGTWEQPMGNLAWVRSIPSVESIELTGDDGKGGEFQELSVVVRKDIKVTRMFFRGGGGEDTIASMMTWGHYFYFQQADANLKLPWYLARFSGRAPFHYSVAQRRSLERTLLNLTKVLKAKRGHLNVKRYMNRNYRSKRIAPVGHQDYELYDLGAGVIEVYDNMVEVQLVRQMKMSKLYKAYLQYQPPPNFAHDRGYRPTPTQCRGFDIVGDQNHGPSQAMIRIVARPDQEARYHGVLRR